MKQRLLALSLLLLFLTGCGGRSPQPDVPAAPPAIQESAEPVPTPEPEPEPPAELIPTPEPEPEPPAEPELSDFVRAADYLPDISVELKYATADNFTGQVIYDFSDAYLRYGTVQKLSAALDLLEAQGYSLLIWDAFRPTAAQFRLWEICPDPVYVANPEKGFSSHSRGNTVDLTLVTLAGEPVEMPTDFDDFSPLADRDYSDVPEPAASHARLLEDVMTDCGFRPYAGEWWHFSDTDDYPVEETFIPESESEASYAHHGD